MKIEGSTRLIDLTLAELFAVLDERDAEREKTAKNRQSLPSVVYGLDGLREIYHCSKSTAARILRSGKINAAVSRISARKFAINVDKALSLCPSNQ